LSALAFATIDDSRTKPIASLDSQRMHELPTPSAIIRPIAENTRIGWVGWIALQQKAACGTDDPRSIAIGAEALR
jgi:hypothetical protein